MIIIEDINVNIIFEIALNKVKGVCTNKMSKAESVFIRPRIGYRAKNDPGD